MGRIVILLYCERGKIYTKDVLNAIIAEFERLKKGIFKIEDNRQRPRRARNRDELREAN